MEITQPIRVRFALSSNPFCLGHLGQKPKKSSNTACLAQDVEGESPGLLHEQQEVVHYPSIVGLRGHPDMMSTKKGEGQKCLKFVDKQYTGLCRKKVLFC